MTQQPHILIVDDDPDLVEMLSMKLQSEKMRVRTAYDGLEAWDRIKEERPDLVVLDVMMPRKNGYELCQELKSNPDYETIKVILLTAVGSAVTSTSYTHKDGMTTLADDYVPKPVDMDRLVELIKDYLN